MGIYVNPPADGFEEILKGGLYVDKTGLIEYMNGVMGTARKLTCFSRPRRFGKSFAAKMLAAYYSRGAEAKALFENLEIAKAPDFEENLNQYDVLFLDITSFLTMSGSVQEVVKELQREVIAELKRLFPDLIEEKNKYLMKALMQIHAGTGRKFFVIIDEWDALFREAQKDEAVQKEYIQFLRSLFKSSLTAQVIAGAYMTGILPIKKYGTQSALTDFKEYTMLEPGPLAEFAGFTEAEVRYLCASHNLDFAQVSRWYDGYQFESIGHVYSPNSIIEAVYNQSISNYWTQTETYESLRIYIDLNYDGLKDAVINLIGGQRCRIDAGSFQNDMTSFKSRDDVFTLLVHLGYLAYDKKKKEVLIPNEEVRGEFVRAVKNGKRRELVKAVELSDQLLEATIDGEEEVVAHLLEEAHLANTSPKFYNNEQALRSVVLMAYLSCMDHYRRFEEIAGGKGYLDMLFLPDRDSSKPALLIELKWDKSAEEALSQIKNNQYQTAAKQYGYQGEILLVGINYNTKTKQHTCKIEHAFV